MISVQSILIQAEVSHVLEMTWRNFSEWEITSKFHFVSSFLQFYWAGMGVSGTAAYSLVYNNLSPLCSSNLEACIFEIKK
jgi:hypothetical protein